MTISADRPLVSGLQTTCTFNSLYIYYIYVLEMLCNFFMTHQNVVSVTELCLAMHFTGMLVQSLKHN